MNPYSGGPMRKVLIPFIAALLAIFAFSAQTAKAGLLDTGQQAVVDHANGCEKVSTSTHKETAILTTDAKTS
ncbi:MAG: hypothetical protein A3D99_00505 [Candidatus Andersenbacteria bacterium RIFCSPHIGHO2_12_FULL_45_11]|uniref:Secreted protein n=1 Tax=Candidatus Andersenbacteria bacterium RIFCSPHIGHO2_12_FULL_45_11 TaxID=1797281 RepID=A0A1G1X2E0_9BACT|nr:MAG: hypothetical protein A3D99_00505 [Candidatus Andersenbacteria bacterium RIFCSPHIGHO2_12_FULL_45_11]